MDLQRAPGASVGLNSEVDFRFQLEKAWSPEIFRHFSFLSLVVRDRVLASITLNLHYRRNLWECNFEVSLSLPLVGNLLQLSRSYVLAWYSVRTAVARMTFGKNNLFSPPFFLVFLPFEIGFVWMKFCFWWSFIECARVFLILLIDTPISNNC